MTEVIKRVVSRKPGLPGDLFKFILQLVRSYFNLAFTTIVTCIISNPSIIAPSSINYAPKKIYFCLKNNFQTKFDVIGSNVMGVFFYMWLNVI